MNWLDDIREQHKDYLNWLSQNDSKPDVQDDQISALIAALEKTYAALGDLIPISWELKNKLTEYGYYAFSATGTLVKAKEALAFNPKESSNE